MSNIVNFGPTTIEFNGVDLGDTVEGGTISPSVKQMKSVDILGNLFYEEELLGGEGSINFFKWATDLALESSVDLTDWGILTLISPKMYVKLWHCKLFLDFDTDFGKLSQNPFKVRFVFGKDSNGKIMNITEVV